MTLQVHRVAGVVAGAVFLVGQASPDVNSSGLGGAGVTFSLIALLLGCLSWFARNQFTDIKKTLEEHGKSNNLRDIKLMKIDVAVQRLEMWQVERTKANEEDTREHVRQLEYALKKKGSGE